MPSGCVLLAHPLPTHEIKRIPKLQKPFNKGAYTDDGALRARAASTFHPLRTPSQAGFAAKTCCAAIALARTDGGLRAMLFGCIVRVWCGAPHHAPNI